MKGFIAFFGFLILTGFLADVSPVAAEVFFSFIVLLWFIVWLARKHERRHRDHEDERPRERVELHLHLKEIRSDGEPRER